MANRTSWAGISRSVPGLDLLEPALARLDLDERSARDVALSSPRNSLGWNRVDAVAALLVGDWRRGRSSGTSATAGARAARRRAAA